MQKLGAFGKKCSVHIKNQISHICVSEGCDDRIVCQDCLLAHNKSHQKFIKSISEILNEIESKKPEKDLKKLSNILGNTNNDQIYKQIEIAEREISENIEKIVKECFGVIMSDIERSKTNFDVLGSLREEVQDIWEENLRVDANNLSVSQESVLKFAGRYSKLTNEIKKTEKKVSSKFLFSSLEVDRFLKDFRNLINSFKARLVQNINSEYEIPILDINIHDFNYSASGTPSAFTSIQCIPEKELLIAGDDKGTVTVMESNYFSKIYYQSQAHKGPITSVKYRNFKNYIFTAGEDMNINCFKINDDNTLKLVETLKEHSKPIVEMVLVESKDIIVSVGNGEPNPKIYDIGSLTMKTTLDTKEVKPQGRAIYLPTRELVGIPLIDGYINLYELDKYTLKYRLTFGEPAFVHSLNYFADLDCLVASAQVRNNSLMALGGRDYSYFSFIWEFKTSNEKPAKIPLPEPAENLFQIKNSANLLITGKSGTLNYLEAKTNKVDSRAIAKSFTASFHDPKNSRIIISDSAQKAVFTIHY